jgi:hypothetical protein
MATYVLAEFETGARMLQAAKHVRELGCGDLDGFSPYPIEGADEALGIGRSPVPLFVLIGGLMGAAFGYLMLYWCNAVDYPLNVGGRPLNSVPAFIPITFELGVLFASMASFASLLGFTGLPRPHHPVFDVDAFRTASVHRFWLSVRLEAREPPLDVMGALGQYGPLSTSTVREES